MNAEDYFFNNIKSAEGTKIIVSADNCFTDDLNANDFIKIMIDFAKLKCKKQRQICAIEAKTFDPLKSHVDRDTILNAPAPHF